MFHTSGNDCEWQICLLELSLLCTTCWVWVSWKGPRRKKIYLFISFQLEFRAVFTFNSVKPARTAASKFGHAVLEPPWPENNDFDRTNVVLSAWEPDVANCFQRHEVDLSTNKRVSAEERPPLCAANAKEIQLLNRHSFWNHMTSLTVSAFSCFSVRTADTKVRTLFHHPGVVMPAHVVWKNNGVIL